MINRYCMALSYQEMKFNSENWLSWELGRNFNKSTRCFEIRRIHKLIKNSSSWRRRKQSLRLSISKETFHFSHSVGYQRQSRLRGIWTAEESWNVDEMKTIESSLNAEEGKFSHLTFAISRRRKVDADGSRPAWADLKLFHFRLATVTICPRAEARAGTVKRTLCRWPWRLDGKATIEGAVIKHPSRL